MTVTVAGGPVPGRQVRGQRGVRHRLRLHGGDVPHGDQEPGSGHLLPRGQGRRHLQHAARPPQGRYLILL